MFKRGRLDIGNTVEKNINCHSWLAGPPHPHLPDDDIPLSRHEAVVAPFLEEGELDADAIVVSPTGNSSQAASNASERRRREEGWTDLGVEALTATARRMNLNALAQGGTEESDAQPEGGA